METTNRVWLNLIADLLSNGDECSPRGKKIKEILGYQTVVPISKPIVTVKQRKLSRKFLFGEAAWILDGRNDVASIAPYNKNISNYSDDGVYFAGAYGPMVVDQLSYVVDSLVKDQDTRQALLTIWRPNPRPSKDYPCTIALQWLIRDGILHCVDTMRSSDAWMGIPYDWFNMSCISAYVALMYRAKTGKTLQLGTLILNAGSEHLYEEQWDQAESLTNVEEVEYAPLNLGEFESASDFLIHLKKMRENKEEALQSPWVFGKELL